MGMSDDFEIAVEEGATAATLLLEMITGAPVPEDVVYQTHLVERLAVAA